MVGFQAPATRAPLTAFIIVIEKVDGHAMVQSLMAGSVVASTISRVTSPPLHGGLGQLQSRRLGHTAWSLHSRPGRDGAVSGPKPEQSGGAAHRIAPSGQDRDLATSPQWPMAPWRQRRY
jgi:hypothetical protein